MRRFCFAWALYFNVWQSELGHKFFEPDLGSVRFLPLLHQVGHPLIDTNLLTSYVSVFIRQYILNSSVLWSKSSEGNPWYKLYAFQSATVLFNISSFLCLKLCYVSYFLNYLTQIALFFFFSEAVSHTCSVKKVFLEISQNSQGNTCATASFFW